MIPRRRCSLIKHSWMCINCHRHSASDFVWFRCTSSFAVIRRAMIDEREKHKKTAERPNDVKREPCHIHRNVVLLCSFQLCSKRKKENPFCLCKHRTERKNMKMVKKSIKFSSLLLRTLKPLKIDSNEWAMSSNYVRRLQSLKPIGLTDFRHHRRTCDGHKWRTSFLFHFHGD